MKRKSDIENARLALGLADRTAVDRVSGSALALIRAAVDILVIVYWCVRWVKMGIIDVFVIPVAMKAVGTLMNFMGARRGVFSDVGYTVQGLGRVINAMVWVFVGVSVNLLFGFDFGLLFFLIPVIYNVLLYRAGGAVVDSLYMRPFEKKASAYSRALIFTVAVATVVVYGVLIYNYFVEETVGTPLVRALYCFSNAERLGVDPFTPFLLAKYRRTFDE